MGIDREELFRHLDKLKKGFYSISTLSSFTKNFDEFFYLIDMLDFLGCKENEDYYCTDFISKHHYQKIKNEEDLLIDYMNFQEPYIFECGENYSKFLNEIKFVPFWFGNHSKKYTFNEVKEIIMSYYSGFDELTQKIVKDFFNSNRFEINVHLDQNNEGMCFYSIKLKKGFITIKSNEFRLEDILTFVHEIGHYIEFIKYILPQSRTLTYGNNFFDELSSKFYEYEFLRFLKKNNINIKDTNDLLNIHYTDILDSYDCYLELMDSGEDVFDFLKKTGINYAVCSYFAIYLSELRKQEPKEFNRIFSKLISNYTVVCPSKILELSEFDKSDFLTCKSIKPTIKIDTDDIKRQYKIKL